MIEEKNNKKNESPHLKVTLPIALIISGIVFAGSIVSGIYNQSRDVTHLRERVIAIESLAHQQYKFADTNEGRLTVVETAFKNLCGIVAEIKEDFKKMREDQLSFYKEQRTNHARTQKRQ
jgi:hypothetical protein